VQRFELLSFSIQLIHSILVCYRFLSFFSFLRLKDNVRAVLYPSGYILTPLRDQEVEVHGVPGPHGVQQPLINNAFGNSCQLTFIAQLDRESVLILSPDLLGESNELRHTFTNLRACLQREYGVRTLQRSKHTVALRAQAGRPEQLAGSTSTSHSRAPSVLSQQNSTPQSFQNRLAPQDLEGAEDTPMRTASGSYSAYSSTPGRGNSGSIIGAAQPSPQLRGNAGPLPVIPEKR
jgi:hypothetical protein